MFECFYVKMFDQLGRFRWASAIFCLSACPPSEHIAEEGGECEKQRQLYFAAVLAYGSGNVILDCVSSFILVVVPCCMIRPTTCTDTNDLLAKHHFDRPIRPPLHIRLFVSILSYAAILLFIMPCSSRSEPNSPLPRQPIQSLRGTNLHAAPVEGVDELDGLAHHGEVDGVADVEDA